MKFMIDAGHYGKQRQSPVVPEYYESEMNWKLQNFLVEELSNYENAECATTRDKQTKDLDLYKRGKKAKGYDFFTSLHSNAFDDEDIDRVDIYYPLDGRNNAKELAEKLIEAIAELMGVSKGTAKTKESTVKKGAEYYSVMYGAQKANCPLYLLIEHSFHTNKKATEWLLNDDNLRSLAEVEADILAEWYGLKEKFVAGDVNGNGVIDARDYLLAKRIYMGTYTPTAEELKRCDIDGDGKVTARDYLLIKRAYFGTYKPKGE